MSGDAVWVEETEFEGGFEHVLGRELALEQLLAPFSLVLFLHLYHLLLLLSMNPLFFVACVE